MALVVTNVSESKSVSISPEMAQVSEVFKDMLKCASADVVEPVAAVVQD